jgi:hypothetical protein
VSPSESENPFARNVAAGVQEIVAAAEVATTEYRRRAESEAVRYEQEQRARVDAELRQLKVNAEAEVDRYLADAKARIDNHANERLTSISNLTDRLIEHADALRQRFEAAETVRRQLYELIAVVGEVAERLAEEAAHPEPEMPKINIPRALKEPA